MPENILRVQMFADKALRMSSYILHPMLMDFQQVHSVKNGNWALHTHFSDFELIIPESGDYFCALDGVEICCVPGEFLLIQPGQSHQDHIQSGHSMHVFHFKLINPEQKSYINQIFSNAVSPAEQVLPLPEATRLLKQTYGVGGVIVTLGGDGAFVDGPDLPPKTYPTAKVPIVDTTAAGDSFTAATALCLSCGQSLEEAVCYANRVAAVSVTRAGAQSSLPTAAEVEAFFAAR